MTSTTSANLGGTFTFPGTNLTVNRLGYGAMQLAGPGVFGPPRDPDAARAVLRAAIAAGVNHIDTSDFYGPHVTNQLIKEALHPYPAGLVIVTKVGATRGADKSWNLDASPATTRAAIDDNLRNLGLDAIDIVNLRVGSVHGPDDTSIADRLATLIDLKREGKVRHIGLSTVSLAQYREARALTEIVCVQNLYNLAARGDDALVDELAKDGVAYVPYFPLGGFSPLQSDTLAAVARAAEATPMQVALAWLLHRAPNMLCIPGTSSVAHLHENLAAARLTLTPAMLGELDGIGALAKTAPAH